MLRAKLRSEHEVTHEPHLLGATALPGVSCRPLSRVVLPSIKAKLEKRKNERKKGGREGGREDGMLKNKSKTRNLERRGKVALGEISWEVVPSVNVIASGTRRKGQHG